MTAGANNGDQHGLLVCVLASSFSLLLPSKIIYHIFATINQLLSDGCCSNDDNSHQPQGSYLTATLKFSLKYSLPRNCDEHDSPIIDSGANSHSILIYVCTTYYPDYCGRKNQNQSKKEKLLINIFFSKSGLAGQHKYLTPIVRA